MANDKIILAYNGGLDTSVAVPWLKENYGADRFMPPLNVTKGEIDEAAERLGNALSKI